MIVELTDVSCFCLGACSEQLFNLFGFFFSVDYPCSGMLGMVSGLIPDSQITASTQVDRNWIPENARLITSRSGWALPPTTHPYANEWLQIDLGEEKIVRGIIVQGGKHRENKVFMKKFKIGYSNNGSDWKMIMDSSKKKIKVRTKTALKKSLHYISTHLYLTLGRAHSWGEAKQEDSKGSSPEGMLWELSHAWGQELALGHLPLW